ncbi:MAG: family 16 glycoside hydrolase, partial [Planctomycetota bacterium]
MAFDGGMRVRRPLPAALLAVVVAFPWTAAGGVGFDGWKPTSGRWHLKGDVYTQTGLTPDCRTFAPSAGWTDYVYELKARKTGGKEGFLILFRVKDHGRFYWWNLGGWGNSRHALETRPPRRRFPSAAGKIETGRWYSVKVAVKGDSIKCFFDGKLIHDVKDGTYKAGGVGLGSWSTQVEYKEVSVTTPDGTRLL